MGTAQQLAPVKQRRATVFSRAVFAAWGLMAEIIGAAIVVFGLFFAALALTGTALVMFFLEDARWKRIESCTLPIMRSRWWNR